MFFDAMSSGSVHCVGVNLKETAAKAASDLSRLALL